jgi:glutamyl-tRNA synthetase
MKRDPAIRLRVPEGAHERVEDGALGVIEQDVSRECGDFVLRRGDGVFAYQLAVVVDDLAMRITDVVRGADLARLLFGEPPRYVHLSLVVASDGSRLAKRTGGASVRALREAGINARTIVGKLAGGLGLTPDDAPRSSGEALEAFRARAIAWPRVPWRVPEEWASIV